MNDYLYESEALRPVSAGHGLIMRDFTRVACGSSGATWAGRGAKVGQVCEVVRLEGPVHASADRPPRCRCRGWDIHGSNLEIRQH